jgi:hypothetical protein
MKNIGTVTELKEAIRLLEIEQAKKSYPFERSISPCL